MRKKYKHNIISKIPFDQIAELAPVIILIYHDHQCIYANTEAIKITGYTEQELMVKRLPDIVHINYKQLIIDAEKEFEQKKQLYRNLLLQLNTKSGEKKWADCKLEILEIDNLLTTLIIGTDVSSIKEAQEQLKENENFLRTILDTIPSPVFHKNKTGVFTGCNQAFADFYGLKKEDIIGKTIHQLAPKKIADNIEKTDAQLFIEQNLQILEGKIMHANKTMRDVIFHKSVLLNHEKEITGLVGIIHDITETRKAESALRESEHFLKTLIYNISQGIVVLNTDFQFIVWNNFTEKLTNIPQEQVIGKTPWECLPFYNPKHKEILKRVLDGEIIRTSDIQFDIISKENNKWISIVLQPYTKPDGQVNGIIAIISDITSRKKYEQTILLNEEKFKNIFNAGTDAIYITNTEGYLLEINDTAQKQLQLKREDIQKLSIYDIFSSSENDIDKYLNALLNGENELFEAVYINKSGKKFILETSGKIIEYIGDNALLHISRDITERKMIEARILNTIIETEERERRFFSENLHDELGPFLSGIKLYINALGDSSVPAEQREKMATYLKQMVDEAIDKTRTISNQLMPSVLVDYGLIKATESFCSKINETGVIKIKTDTDENTTRYPKIVEQILYRTIIELINNTIKHAKAKNINIQLKNRKNILYLQYKDDGTGFDLSKVLENQKGMGIRNILNRIKSIYGRYYFKSEPEKGIRLTIEIDLSAIS